MKARLSSEVSMALIRRRLFLRRALSATVGLTCADFLSCYLAEDGKELFPDRSVISSMETGSFHSGERLKAHMGSYNLRLTAEREEDERSVTQAFAEAFGRAHLLPNLSWHWWLSDGEL